MLRITALILSLFFLTSIELPSIVQANDNGPEKQVQKVISDQIAAFLEGDDDRAYSHAAPTIKQVYLDSHQFVEMVRNAYKPLYKPSNFRFGKNKWHEGILYQQVITTDEADKVWEAVYSMILFSDGNWKINGVVMNPMKGDAI